MNPEGQIKKILEENGLEYDVILALPDNPTEEAKLALRILKKNKMKIIVSIKKKVLAK